MLRKAGKSQKTAPAVLIPKIVIAAIAIVAFCFPTMAVTYHCSQGEEWWRHVAAVFSHANIFHLAANLYCMALIRFKADWITAFIIALCATFLPAPVWSWKEMGFVIMPTCGLSGMILAAIAAEWAKVRDFKSMLKWLVVPILPLTIVPNINTSIHLYCIFIAFLTKRYIIK